MAISQKSMLGDVTALTITTPDLETSLAYYRQLGFSEIFRADQPFPWIQISDGVLLIMLRKDPMPYIALTYYVKDIANVVAGVAEAGITFTQKPGKTDAIQRYLFTSPDGLNISLVSIVEGFTQPAGPGMLAMPKEDYFNPDKYVNKTCGLFGELAHPVSDLLQSIAFWERLGFKVMSRFESPYPWAILSDGLSVIGLHQSADFAFPAITYFAADMAVKIEQLQKNGLQNYTPRGPGNVMLTTPEQQHIFLFSLGSPAKKKPDLIDLPVIETERLLLKELGPDSLRRIFSTFSDEEIMRLTGADAKQLEIDKNKVRLGMTTYRMTFKQFLLVEKESGRTIGKCSLHHWYAEHRRAELGYNMSDENAKRKGLMTEAAKAIIKHGFETMNLNRIEAYTSPKNTASVRLLENCGFTREGSFAPIITAMG